MEISLRYPPVKGRLHTRYAPVRRSPPRYCYLALPLDLHVLSLPLAFILSQDQTLHCKNCSFTFIDSSSCRTHISICMPTHAISFFSSVSNYSVLLWRKTAAKVQPFSKLPKYFFKKINGILFNYWSTTCCIEKKISHRPQKQPPECPEITPGCPKLDRFWTSRRTFEY